MKFIVAAIVVFLSVLLVAPETAKAQEACELYKVRRGDDLLKISKRAYGYNNFRGIYRANRKSIGRNPNRLRVGIVLKLPCKNGSIAKKKIDAPKGPEFSFVTANGYRPYTDENLQNSGLLTHLVKNALLRATPEKRIEIVFVNDWSAHLETLLPRMVFDASFPATRPGCETQGLLTRIELYACQNYLYSDPFIEIVEGFVAKTGAGFENMSKFSDLMGATICRPEGYPTGHLEEQNLMPPEISLVQPATANECFAQLMADKVDLVALDTRTAGHVVSDMELEFQVTENPYLFSIEPLRVALHKDNPKSADMIADLNAGLQVILQSGEWNSIVTQGLEQAELVN